MWIFNKIKSERELFLIAFLSFSLAITCIINDTQLDFDGNATLPSFILSATYTLLWFLLIVFNRKKRLSRFIILFWAIFLIFIGLSLIFEYVLSWISTDSAAIEIVYDISNITTPFIMLYLLSFGGFGYISFHIAGIYLADGLMSGVPVIMLILAIIMYRCNFKTIKQDPVLKSVTDKRV